MGWVRSETPSGAVALDAAIGNLRELCFVVGDREISPLHTAPWVDGATPDDMAPVERSLSGDFFCAPFGASDVESAPPHGWSANSHWSLTRLERDEIELHLDRRVLGASITKMLRLSHDAPLLYQTHRIEGGHGALTLAHHPMVRICGRGWLSVSPKSATLTPEVPLETGRNALVCPARVDGFAPVPSTAGGKIDLAHLPIAEGCEDFVTLVENTRPGLGWTAVTRDVEDDIVFFLKDADVLPVTMLWHSNGGRDYAPWSGRHTGVLGIEDGCAAGAAGHLAALSPNPVSEEGVPTALPLGSSIVVRHVTGAIPRPTGWTHVADIRVANSELILIGAAGGEVRMPFDPTFLAEVS